MQDATNPADVRQALRSASSLLELLPCATLYADAEGRVLYTNEEARRRFGPAIEHLAALPMTFRPDGEPHDARTHPAWRALREGAAVRDEHLVLLAPDGGAAWLRVHALPLGRRGTPDAGLLLLAEDVTTAQRGQQALEETEEAQRLALESVKDYAILTLDGTGFVVGSNPGARRLHGDPPGGLLEHHLAGYLAGPEAAADAARLLERAAREGSATYEGWLVREGGAPFWGRIVLTRLQHDDDRLRGFVSVGEDLTERRRLEEGLRQLNASLREEQQRREAIFRSIAHDLRNPLTPLRLRLYMLKGAVGQGTEATRHLQVIERSLARLERLVDDLAELVRLEGGQRSLEPRPFDLGRLLREELEAVEAVAREQGVAVGLDVPGTVRAQGDRALVGRVVANLLSNALKHTPAGGRVDVRARDEGTAVRVDVEDTGTGIEPSLAGHLFESFRRGTAPRPRTGAEGMGLGLYISKGIVDAHGGTIEGRSRGPGKGSVFTFTLPAARDEAEAAEADPTAAPSEAHAAEQGTYGRPGA